jgi:hypothetical protein
MRGTSASIGILLAALAGACADEDAFTTGAGECFRGRIVGADFVRTGFDERAGALFTIDVRALTGGSASAGRLWITDGTFSDAAVSQMEQISSDAISLLQFPGGRIRNYLAHALPADGAPAVLVISLMENDRVELRVIRPPAGTDDGPPALFGVFRLSLDENCAIPEAS